MGGEGEKDKKVFLQIRVNKSLKKAFEDACEQSDLTVSQVLRAHMREYVERAAGGAAKGEVADKAGKHKIARQRKGDVK